MKDDRVYLLHIRDSVQRIFQYTAAGKAVFLSETICMNSCRSNLERLPEIAAIRAFIDAISET